MERQKLVLASSSEIRRQIVARYDVECIYTAPLLDEELEKTKVNLKPIDLSNHLAKEKARSLINDYQDHFILGCDQICLFKDKIYEKPGSKEKAIANLMELNGQTHQLIGSYVVFFNKEEVINHISVCEMTMKTLTSAEIEEYVNQDNPIHSCGAYKFEENGYKLFSNITGSLEAINGLPFSVIYKMIKNV